MQNLQLLMDEGSKNYIFSTPLSLTTCSFATSLATRICKFILLILLVFSIQKRRGIFKCTAWVLPSHTKLHSVAACIDRKIGNFKFRAFFEKYKYTGLWEFIFLTF